MDYTIPENLVKIQKAIKRLVKEDLEPISRQVEEDEHIPEEIVDKMRSLGLFGISIPKEYGGLGIGSLGEVLIYEELTKTNACFRSRIGGSNGIGSMGILMDGTEGQKRRYLPRIASGEWTAAFALTEAEAGSDAANIKTTATFDGRQWVLNGIKLFITNGDCAHVITTMAVNDESKGARGGITAFIIEKGMKGLSVGSIERKMGIRGSHTAELAFSDCIVPKENVIGGEAMVGKGFKTAMRVLDKGRLTIGACSLGASQKLLEMCVDHAKKKAVSGKPLAQSQAIQFMLADMATQIYAARQILYHAAWLRDQGAKVVHEASMAKLFCTEMASQIADKAMDLFGDIGCMKDAQVEMYLRDVRLYRIYEGTSEIQKIVISRNLLKALDDTGQ